jgi:hypothetical protein
MSGKQILHLLTITTTLSILAIQFNHQSAPAISAEKVGQQRGQETAQANSIQDHKNFESSIPKCLVSFMIGAHIIYVRKRQLK